MRRWFKLRKGINYTTPDKEYNLMSIPHFFNAPEGLGFDIEFSTLRSGDEFIITEEHQSQKQISGEMVFASYNEYGNFIDFIGTNEDVYLGYLTLNQTDYWWIPVKVASINKGEKDSSGRLICPITFTAFGLWRQEWSGAGQTLTIRNGLISSPVRLTLGGYSAITSATWEIVQNGQVISDGAWNGTLNVGQELVIDSTPTSMEMAKYENGVFVSNEYQNGDFNTDRFIWAPPGESTINLSVSGSVKVYKYAYTV